MHKRDFLTLSLKASACCTATGALNAAYGAVRSEGVSRVELPAIEAALAFLSTLSAEQRGKVQFPHATQGTATAKTFMGGFDGHVPMVGEQYGMSVWSNFPVSDVPRPGLRIGDLSVPQREAFMNLLETLMSPKGYAKVLDIMGSDQELFRSGVPYVAGFASYTIGVFGAPKASGPWMLQFGGHHLALNFNVQDDRVVLAPVLTGALPAVYTVKGKRVRALADENDKAFTLHDTLDEEQRTQADFNHDVSDLVLGPGQDGKVPRPIGLPASKMTAAQRALLSDLIFEWVGLVSQAQSVSRMAEIEAGLDDTYFAWSGPSTHKAGRNGSSYFRIQGPTLAIEFSPQQPGGDLTMHVHTVYRDFKRGYGREAH